MIIAYISACWEILLEMSPYMLFGFLMAGGLHVLVQADAIAKYMGKGRIKSVLCATLLGIPLPLCSCGVLPTVAALKKQGANDGAALAFLIATPESGVDSMAVTYALLDPLMTVFRPLAAFVTAFTAGVMQNVFGGTYDEAKIAQIKPDLSCKVDHCCDGNDCPPETHRNHHTLAEKLAAAARYGFGEILDDIAGWLVIGVAIAGLITVLIPENFLSAYVGGGLPSMLVMLAIGIPLYICATASTPIAAALIMKGVSPGAALVFLLSGPATNAATISVVFGLFRKRTAAIYLASIAICALLMGFALDKIYGWLHITAQSAAGSAGELAPPWLSAAAALLLMALIGRSLLNKWRHRHHHHHAEESGCGGSCACSHHKA